MTNNVPETYIKKKTFFNSTGTTTNERKVYRDRDHEKKVCSKLKSKLWRNFRYFLANYVINHINQKKVRRNDQKK